MCINEKQGILLPPCMGACEGRRNKERAERSRTRDNINETKITLGFAQ